jgi:hypothetical protein
LSNNSEVDLGEETGKDVIVANFKQSRGRSRRTKKDKGIGWRGKCRE